jgi:RNA polymerase sigma-32 factor
MSASTVAVAGRGAAWPVLSAASLETYIHSVGQIPVLSTADEHALAVRACSQQDRAAAQALILSNLRFVIHIARGYQGYGLPLCDLIQEGNVGLIKALRRFKPEQEVRLVSFAVHWIRAEIHEYIYRNWRIVRLVTTKAQRRLFFNLRKKRRHQGWLSPGEAEAIGAELRVKPHEVLEMSARMAPDVAIGAGPEPQAGTIAESLIEDSTDAIADLEQRDWSAHCMTRVREGLRRLDARSRDIVERRWLGTGQPAQLEELGARHGISAERVRQIQNRAIRRLREHVELPAARA